MNLHSPLPELVSDSVRMDAALARLLNLPLEAEGRMPRGEVQAEQAWRWIEPETAGGGLEITEHALPEGIDFHQFATLVGPWH